jgi:hypothetical protein
MLKISKIAELLNATIVCGEKNINQEVEYAFASDLMSDVLTLEPVNVLLITGLANIQTIRTAEMAYTRAILLVRNKKASNEMIALANENDNVILEYTGSMFKASGILYSAGLKAVY